MTLNNVKIYSTDVGRLKHGFFFWAYIGREFRMSYFDENRCIYIKNDALNLIRKSNFDFKQQKMTFSFTALHF